jgi:phosphopantothenoylcysteine decarboxylase/phosphopantothenate--cysteine ligase
VERLVSEIAFEKNLKGKKVLITAGATKEAIDPVRYITNHSTGKMGYALAKMAKAKGADVTLISGETSLKKPIGVKFCSVVSAEDMYKAVSENFDDASIVIKAAAVADFRPIKTAENKVKKKDNNLNIELERTTDILEELGKRKKNQILVGFCMETENLLENAREKLKRKNLDMICANSLTEEGAGFGKDTNIITVIEKNGRETRLPLDTKENLAASILDLAAKYSEENV